jgi:biopolymer transport protein ExbB
LISIIQAAGWPIWPLIACSIVAMALIVERFVSLRTRKVAPANLLDEVLIATRTGIPPSDVISRLEQSCAFGEVLASALRLRLIKPHSSEEEIRATVEASGRLIAHKLDRYLSTLGTIASIAPLLGLLGTVIGMIEIFGGQSSAAGVVGNPAQLAHGISTALYNTAFGLIVAIPSLIFWRYFKARVDAYLLTIELGAERLLQQIIHMRRLA